MNDEYGYGTAPGMAPLPDVPDLRGITPDEREPWEDGWYSATAIAGRSFTSNETGVTTTFTSGDEVSKGGDSRNITVQLQVRRKNGDVLNGRVLVNYKLEFLTSEVIGQVTQHKQAMKDAKAAGQKPPEWGPLFRAFSSISQIGTLQRIAGVRQFVRNGAGGLDITPVFGKTLFVRLGPDERKPQYKQVVDFADVAPKKAPIL